MTKAEKTLRRVRLELARDHDFPNGSSERRYDSSRHSKPSVGPPARQP